MLDKFKNLDRKYLLVFMIILLLGLVMVLSSSSIFSAFSPKLNNNPFYIFQKRIIGVFGAFFISLFVFLLPYKKLKFFAYPLLILTGLGLIFILIPGFSVTIANTKRWLKVGPFTFQVSELAKLAVILFLAKYYEKYNAKHPSSLNKDKKETKNFLVPLFILAILMSLIYMEPDFGTSIEIFIIFLFMLFIVGIRMEKLVLLSVIVCVLGLISIMKTGYQYSRLIGFLNPMELSQDEGYQIVQSVIAFGKGGIFGVGLGNSFQKLFYLPQSYSDFIFSIIGEELGFIGSFATLVLFGFLSYYGIKIGREAPDSFSRLLVYGISFHILFQAILNIGVCIGLLPSKGLTLPFISAGVSALLINTIEIAIVLNISTYNRLNSKYKILNSKRI